MPNNINISTLINQDNGLIATIHANSMAISKIAMSDNTISEESKDIIEQLTSQNQIYIAKLASLQASKATSEEANTSITA